MTYLIFQDNLGNKSPRYPGLRAAKRLETPQGSGWYRCKSGEETKPWRPMGRVRARSHAAALPGQNISATFLPGEIVTLLFRLMKWQEGSVFLVATSAVWEQSEGNSSVVYVWSSLRYLARVTFSDLPPALCVFLCVSDRSWVPSRFM